MNTIALSAGGEMAVSQPRMFRLDQSPNGQGLYCNTDGLFLGGEPLLQRGSDRHFRPRPPRDLRKMFDGLYRVEEADWSSRIRSVDVVAKALNKGDLARAMIAAVLMRLPEPDGFIGDEVLAKAGFDPSEPRDESGRWTSDGDGDDAKLIPVQAITAPYLEPLVGPLIEQVPAKPVPLPSPTDIVPPIVGSPEMLREPASNPYPNRKKCVKEWERAEKYCWDLIRRGKLGADGHRGAGKTYDQCLRGQVSAECGGNPTAFETYIEA